MRFMDRSQASESNRRSRLAQWGILVGLLAVFSLAFALLHTVFGLSVGMLAIIPILLGAWYLGAWWSLIFTALTMFVAIGLSYVFDYTTEEIFIHQGGALAILATFLITVVIGKLGEKIRAHTQETIEHQRSLTRTDARVRFMVMLNGIVRASLEAEDMPSLLKVLTNHVSELFAADECLISLCRETGSNRQPLVYSSTGRTYSTAFGQPDLARSILETAHALAIEDTSVSTYFESEPAKDFHLPRSVLGLPLVAGGQRLGVVILGFAQAHLFSLEEKERGELAARQISLAMTKVLLLEEARNQVRELAGLHQISQAFSMRGGDRHTYALLTEILANQMGTEMCAISLLDPITRELRTQTPAYGLSDDLANAFHFPIEMGRRAWSDFEAKVFRANTREEIPSDFLPLVESFGVKCVIVAPLRDPEGKWIGAIFAANKPGGFSEDDAHMLEALSGQVTVVIQDTLLLRAERQRAEELDVLHAVAAATTEADIESELIARVTSLIGERLYPESFDTFLLDDTTMELYLQSSYRQGESEELLRVPLGIGITGTVARLGKPRRVEDVTKTPEYLSFYPLTRSELCVPLKVEGQVIGVVNAESNAVNAFSEKDEELLTILAGQLATAIQRLRTAKAEHRQADQLSRSNALIRALAQLGARASAAVDPDGVMQTLGNELAKLGLRCMIALSDPENKVAIIRYTSLPKRIVSVIERITRSPIFDSAIQVDRLSGGAEPLQKSSLISDPTALVLNIMPGFSRQAAIKILKSIGVIETTSVCQLPLVTEGKPVGILWMWGEGLHDNDLPAMSLFASQVATALQNANLLAEVQRLAITDELTGIFNRRHFYSLAEREFGRAQRYRHALAALIVDIDHFKQFNDQYGHLIGDVVLREVARVLQATLRESDILGRYGGEEFSILLPVTDMKSAKYVGERLRSQVAQASIQSDVGELHVQVSVGVAGISAKTPTLNDLINRADQAMYRAKEAGRNCVKVI